MFDAFTIIPLFFFLGAAYLFNKRNRSLPRERLFLISSLEAVFSYLLVYILFFEGYYDYFFAFFIMLIAMLTVAIVLFWLEENRKELLDLQIETIKNTLIIFALTFLPFYVFLTIFRFQPAFLQVLYSLILTVIVYLLHMPLQRLLSPLWSFIVDLVENTFAAKYVVLWLIAVLLTATIALFDYPGERVKEALNLADHVNYFTYDGYETDLENDFRAEENIRVVLDEALETERINDYWTTEDTLYLYTYENEVIAIDRSSKETLYAQSLGWLEDYGTTFSRKNIRYHFFTDEEALYVLAKTGIFRIDRDGHSTVTDDLTFFNARLFYDENTASFLRQTAPMTYEVYALESGTISSSRTIRLADDGSGEPIVIDERLFTIEDGSYRFEGDIRYPIDEDAITIFDHSTMTMTHIVNTDHQTSAIRDITLRAIDEDGNERIETLNQRYDLTGIIAGDEYYMTNFEEGIERIDIVDSDLRPTAIHRPIVTEPVWFEHAILDAYVATVKDVRGSFEYLQVENSRDRTYLTIRELNEEETGLDLPFYSHYQPLIFIAIAVAMLIPVTDNRQYITFIGFHYLWKKDKPDSE
ncbi:MAG: hypothetical protein ACLFTZ_03935 [Acholeplasmataceae bacterium]